MLLLCVCGDGPLTHESHAENDSQPHNSQTTVLDKISDTARLSRSVPITCVIVSG